MTKIGHLGIILISLFYSCEIKDTNMEDTSLGSTISQKKFTLLCREFQRGADLNYIVENFFSNSKMKISADINELYKSLFTNIVIHLKSSKNIRYYWNDEISSVQLYDWLLDKSHCTENLLMMLNSKEGVYYSFCYDENGKIISMLPIYDFVNDQANWLELEM